MKSRNKVTYISRGGEQKEVYTPDNHPSIIYLSGDGTRYYIDISVMNYSIYLLGDF